MGECGWIRPNKKTAAHAAEYTGSKISPSYIFAAQNSFALKIKAKVKVICCENSGEHL